MVSFEAGNAKRQENSSGAPYIPAPFERGFTAPIDNAKGGLDILPCLEAGVTGLSTLRKAPFPPEEAAGAPL